MSRIGGLVRRLPLGSRRVPDTICPLPWVNLSLDVDGSSRPCCKFAHQENDSRYQMANLRDGGLERTWNSEAMQRLRRDFRAGRKPGECSTCWDEEAAGIASFRQTYVRDRDITDAEVDFDDLTPAAPKALDLKLSNSCNLKCRICGPVASSLWLSEELRSDVVSDKTRQFLKDNQVYFRSNKVTEVPDSMATFRSWVPHLEHLELTGGEPMLSPENREVIELIVREGHPERVGLLLTTNGVVIDERIMEHLPKFKWVTISLSIDDIGKRLEYERSPCNWEKVQANIDRYAALASDSIRIFTNCSISVLNAWYLPEYLDWLEGRYPGGEVEFNLNLVHGARHFCVQVLPEPAKRALTEKLSTAARGRNGTTKRQIDELIEFLTPSRRGDADDWEEAIQTITQRDAVRNEHFELTFPEWHGVLLDAGAWPSSAPVSVPAPRRRDTTAGA